MSQFGRGYCTHSFLRPGTQSKPLSRVSSLALEWTSSRGSADASPVDGIGDRRNSRRFT
jgi:hypothetical protein